MNFALISNNPFPIGNVATNRYTTYCQSLAQKGHFVKILILPFVSMDAIEINGNGGISKQIHYLYLQKKQDCFKKNMLIKLIFFLKGLLESLCILTKDKIDVVILYDKRISVSIFYWIYTRLSNKILITDRSEYPVRFFNKGSFGKFLETVNISLYDGLLIMTDELINFYSKYKSKKALLFHFPMTIDSERFMLLESKISAKYIACVFGTHNRDCVLDTIMAYKMYCQLIKDTPYSLWLIGDFNNLIVKPDVQNYIKSNNLEELVIIKGAYLADKIPQMLFDATCLITTARSYKSGGFPTKLGEYLATGKPVIATAAGEIPLYLEDRLNAFLPTPGNIQEIAEALIFIHQNPKTATEIGYQGSIVAKSSFNSDTYIPDFIHYIEKLNER